MTSVSFDHRHPQFEHTYFEYLAQMARFALLTILVCCGIHCGDVLEASLCQEETDATDSTTAIFMYKLFHSLFHLIDEHKKKEGN